MLSQPIAIRLRSRESLYHFVRFNDTLLVEVDEEHPAGSQSRPVADVGRRYIQNTRLGCHNQQVVFRDGVSERAEPVAVQDSAQHVPVCECDHGGSVPRLHDPAVVLVEVLDRLRHVLVAVPRGRHQHGSSVLNAPAPHVDRFKRIVQGCSVRRSIILANRKDVFHVAAE